jgi:adenosine kinase
VFNIAAPFLIEQFFDQMNEVLPYTDIVLGNEHEAAAFGKKMNWVHFPFSIESYV